MMKKGKVFGKGQVAVAVMLLGLAAAVWLNAKFLPTDTKYLGDASYVQGSADENGEALETGASVSKDYFANAKKEREEALEKASETVEELLKSDSLTEEDKKSALAKIEELADRIEKENNIESLLKAKGFEKAVAIIGDKGISIVVGSEGLTSAQTLQIQDIVVSETSISLGNIKIIPKS